jgi:hypothetical protein
VSQLYELPDLHSLANAPFLRKRGALKLLSSLPRRIKNNLYGYLTDNRSAFIKFVELI